MVVFKYGKKNYFFENCLIWLNLFFDEFFGLIKIKENLFLLLFL